MLKTDIIRTLALEPHPEGGYFRRTYASKTTLETKQRSLMSAIYYLCDGDAFSRWHRIDSDELWLWHTGAPLMLEIENEKGEIHALTLGADLYRAQALQHPVPAGCWQRAQSLGDWTLVSCVVSPAFSFDHFEMRD